MASERLKPGSKTNGLASSWWSLGDLGRRPKHPGGGGSGQTLPAGVSVSVANGHGAEPGGMSHESADVLAGMQLCGLTTAPLTGRSAGLLVLQLASRFSSCLFLRYDRAAITSPSCVLVFHWSGTRCGCDHIRCRIASA